MARRLPTVTRLLKLLRQKVSQPHRFRPWLLPTGSMRRFQNYAPVHGGVFLCPDVEGLLNNVGLWSVREILLATGDGGRKSDWIPIDCIPIRRRAT